MKPCLANDHEARFARVVSKWAIVICIDARPNGLQSHAHRAAFYGGKAFEAEDVVGADDLGHFFSEGISIRNLAQRDHKAFESVMIVVVMMVVMVIMVIMAVIMIMMVIVIMVMVIIIVMMVVMHLTARVHVAFRANTLTQQHIQRQRPHGGADHLHTVA